MPIRITGMNSGLDTEALISELVSAYRTKTQKYTKAQKKLSWKQEIWKNLNSKVSSFYSKLTNLKYSSAYNIRTATVSDATKATVSASSSAVNGSYSVRIDKIAKGGYLTGGDLGSGVTGDSTLSSLGYTGGEGTITVNSGGKTTDIKVDGNTKISDFVDSLNQAGVKASYDATHHRIYVAAAKTGAAGDFSITGTGADGAAALNAMKLSWRSQADDALYKEWAAYAKNENGDPYITYDADGTKHINGTYSAANTKSAITAILAQVEQAPVTITKYTAYLQYADAYKTVKDTENKLTADENRDLQSLAKEGNLTDVYIDQNGTIYDKAEDGTYSTRGDNKQTYTEAELTAAGISVTAGKDRLDEIAKKAGFTKQVETEDESGAKVTTTEVDESKVNAYKVALSTKEAYESEEDEDGNKVHGTLINTVQQAYSNASSDADPEAAFKVYTDSWQKKIDDAQATLDKYALFDNPAFDPDNVTEKITNAAGVLDGSITISNSEGATRVNGQDAEIYVNDAKYVSTTNSLVVNGLTINALAETKGDEITITVANNTQGLYDKIKDILKDYNALINEMTKLYDAGSSRGYEPLTNEEKDAMTDTEIEEWEKKIKDSLLRRDDSLGSLLNGMTTAMLKSYNVNGKNYSLSSFGIHTLGILNSADNEQNAFHIDGNQDDPLTSGNADKLMAALVNDPDSVVEFMKQLTGGVYDVINKKMSSTSLSSFNHVYNDKEMAREYSDYTKTINKWEEKLEKMEDSYYKKFAAMESALATLQSQQSYLASLFG